jgi:hypothetical protein
MTDPETVSSGGVEEMRLAVPEARGTKVIVSILGLLNIGLIGVLIPLAIITKTVLKEASNPQPSNLDYLAAQFAESLPESMLPSRYVVDRSYWVPATDQASRGTCWAFATIYLLQSQYRAQGIRSKYLEPDEYVNLSVQAYVSLVGNWCRSHPTEKVCGYGGFLKNTTNDNEVELLLGFLEAIPSLNKSIVPESVCPYSPSRSAITDFKCDGLGSAIENNPIEFGVKRFDTVYDLRGVKQLLYTAKRPIGLGTPTGAINYYIPCEGSPYATGEACTKRQFPCPNDQNGSFCHILRLSSSAGEGIFLTVDEIERIQQTGGHAMNILGYNDDWRYNSRFSVPESIAKLKGAFVLHNSWGSRGHSIEFLMGQRTLENEEATCPNTRDPLNWIPATYLELENAGGNVSKIDTAPKRIRGHTRTEHPDLLTCSDSSNITCVYRRKYVLGRRSGDTNSTAIGNGLYRTQLWDVTDAPTITSRDVIYPFWALGTILMPTTMPLNDLHNCGFWAMPYQTMEALRRRNWDLFDNFKVTDIEVEFTPASYASAAESQGKDLSYLLNSTYTIPEVKFDGPIPFDLIYH